LQICFSMYLMRDFIIDYFKNIADFQKKMMEKILLF